MTILVRKRSEGDGKKGWNDRGNSFYAAKEDELSLHGGDLAVASVVWMCVIVLLACDVFVYCTSGRGL